MQGAHIGIVRTEHCAPLPPAVPPTTRFLSFDAVPLPQNFRHSLISPRFTAVMNASEFLGWMSIGCWLGAQFP